MYTALERHRIYALGPAQLKLIYLGREFPEDHPAVFEFSDPSTGETIAFSLSQLTKFEREGNLHYLGPAPLNSE